MDRCEYDWIANGAAGMTAPLPASKKARGADKVARQKSIRHSLYLGRERLGRYVQKGRKRFKAFDALDRPLGNFRTRARALAAIRKAWARFA
jgi:hypothetical protein